MRIDDKKQPAYLLGYAYDPFVLCQLFLPHMWEACTTGERKKAF
jgi:hypothetical protein